MAKNEYTHGSVKTEQGRKGGPMGGPMGGGRIAEKPKNFKKSIGKLLRFVGRDWIFIAIALFFAAAGTVISIIGPDKIKDITNLIYSSIVGLEANPPFTLPIDLDEITRLGVTLAVMYGAGVIFNYIQGFIMATVTQRTAKSLRASLGKKINKVPLKYFDSTNFGNIMSRVTNDVDTIAQTLNQSVSSLVSAVIMFAGSLIMMFVTNWILALAAVGASLLGFVLMAVIMKNSQKYFVAQQRELGRLNGHIEEVYAGHNVVKAYNGEKSAKEAFRGMNDELCRSGWKSQFMSGLMMPLMGFVGNLGYIAVCVTGSVLVLLRNGDVGTIAAFMIYVRLFTQPLSQMAQGATSLQSAAAAGERVFDFLDREELEDESHKTEVLTEVKGDVEFRNVRFGYNEDKIIISDFSAHASAGQKIAIVGPTGAGKTTMVNLLMRFYELNGGSILIDGVPVSELTRENVHALFSMVLQDTWLFEGTIRENIVYAKQGEVSDGQLHEICRAAEVDHFILTLPDGYDTVLSDNVNISAGQKQLLTIARAMIEDAPMLILDEATSSVDTRTEQMIQRAMDKLMKGRTSFIIAHRLSTIKNADLILVMKDGDIIETGKHETLMEQGGFYAELYNSQFEQAETA